MILYIVRHAWAGHYGDPQWPDDFQRPLGELGIQRFGAFVKKLAGRGFLPQTVATSPLVRCRQTAELIVEGVAQADSKIKGELVELDLLRPGGDFAELIAWTAERSRNREQIAWVGHAPGVGRFASELSGCGGGNIRFAKGAVAAIKFYDLPRPGEGELRWLVTAKMLGC